MYQPADYTLTSKFGDQARFSAMVTSCHNAGVKVYADAVINHMTGQGSTSYGGASFSKYDYPGLYSGFDFHFFPEDCGNADGTIHDGDFGANAGNVQRCELVGLSDLETEEEYVRATIAGYLKIRFLNGFGQIHNAVRGTAPVDFQAPGSRFIGFGRGGAGFVAINNGGGSATSTFTTGLPAGTYADVIHPGSTVTVNAAGQATLTVGAKDAVAFHVGG